MNIDLQTLIGINRDGKLSSQFVFEGVKELNQVPFFSPNSIQCWNEVKESKLEFGDFTHFYPNLLQLCKGEQERSVCAKLVSKGQTIIQCYDCRMDPSCIICHDCFKNGNHEGHKVIFKKAFGGCCDCGDPQAWKPSGFCCKHSGEAKDIHIEQHIINEFCKILHDIIYMYFRIRLTAYNSKFQNHFFSKLCKTINLISNNVKGIKLLSIVFQTSLPKTLFLSSKLEGKQIIQLLLTFKLMRSHLKEWQNIFIEMFPYYQFKKQLIAAYIDYFGSLYAGDTSGNAGQSLSCQILTSYKLVEEYIQSQGSKPLGFNLLGLIQQNQYISYVLAADMDKINSLQGDVPFKYWKLFINHGIDSLFAYYEQLKKQFQKEKKNKGLLAAKSKTKKAKKNYFQILDQKSESISFVIRNSKIIQNEYNLIELLISTMPLIEKDANLLLKMLKNLYILISKDISTGQDFIIFRPYDRIFGLTLYYLINNDLSKLQDKTVRSKIRQSLQLSEQQWQHFLQNLNQRMLTTFMFFSHILTNQNKGYHSSFYNYLYFYQVKNRLMSSLDILQLKMIAILSQNQLQINFDQIIRIQQIQPPGIWTLNHLNYLLKEIGLVYIGKMSQIFISLSNQKHTPIYHGQILNYLKKFISSQDGAVTLQKAVQFSNNFLFTDNQKLKAYLRQIATYNKDKKIFELKAQCRDNDSFNFQDFPLRTKFTNKSSVKTNPKFTTQFISKYNRTIFQKLWGPKNIQKINKIIMRVYDQLNQKKIMEDMKQFFILVCKFVFILIEIKSQGHEIIKESLLKRMQISQQMRKQLTFYDSIFGEMIDEAEDKQSKFKQKKDLLRDKKMKKLQQLKQKQSGNMDKTKENHDQIMKKMQLQEQIDTHYCVICRKKQQNNYQLVYLAQLNIRDLQKIVLPANKGVKTISFTSCYHVFDYDCIRNSQITKKTQQIVFKCPVCRRVGNTFFPVEPLAHQQQSQPFVQACLERIINVMMVKRNYSSIDALQQLLICFYHYVIIAQFHFDYVKAKRRRLYRTIIQLMKSKIFQQSIQLLKAKFDSSILNVRPKILKRSTKKVNLLQAEDQQELINQLQVQEDEENQLELIQYLQEQNLRFLQMISRGEHFGNAVEKKISEQTKNKKSAIKKKSEETTDIFKYTISRIIEVIQNKSKSSLPSKEAMVSEEEHSQIIEEDNNNFKMPKEIKIIMDDLLGEPTDLTEFISQRLKFQVELPQIYYFDMSKNVCDFCLQNCPDTIKCLLCPWKGCLNCKNGGINKHTRLNHGQVTPIMRINDASTYLISCDKITKIGCLYTNEWGQDFNLKKEWADYTFQEQTYQKIKLMLLVDQQ